MYKKLGVSWGIVCCLLLAGCGGADTTTVTVQDLSFAIPTDYQAISSQSLDNSQITHDIIAAWKATDSNIILAESTLPAGVSLQEFSQKAQTRLSQEMIGYANPTLTKKNIECNSKTENGYLHSFQQTDLQDNTKIIGYYDQYYFSHNGSIYTLSVAQKEKKSIVGNMISSIRCSTHTTQ